MAWYKWRQMMAWGYTKYQYIQFNKDIHGYDNLGEYLDENGMLNNWSDKWRKVEWVQVPRPPKKVLQDEIEDAKERIKEAKEKLKQLQADSRKYYPNDYSKVSKS